VIDPAHRPHWVKYVRWDVIASWRAATLGGARTRRYPYAFASNDRAFPRVKGGVLWLISSPRYGSYRQPPSVVARLDVANVVASDAPEARDVDPIVRRFGRWIALGSERHSVYLPLNNATRTLEQLRFTGTVRQLPTVPIARADAVAEHPFAHIPGHFQRHRVLDADSVRTLEDYAEAVRRGRRVFISYRWSDFEGQAAWLEELATVLTDRAVSCWLDQWNVPQSRETSYDNKLLRSILNDAVRQSAWFVALMRPDYVKPGGEPGVPTWVSHEWDQARSAKETPRRDRMRRIAVTFGKLHGIDEWVEGAEDTAVSVGSNASARDVAGRVLATMAT
jgi:TIR domain